MLAAARPQAAVADDQPNILFPYLGDFKLIQNFEDDALELYNLREDIGESTDLSTSNPAKTQELLAQLQHWQKHTSAPIPTTPNPKFDADAERETIAGGEPANLLETIPAGASPKPAERALVVDFADRVNHVEAAYDQTGAVNHLEISNHPMWIARHALGDGRVGLSDAEFRRITELGSLKSLRVLQQPLSDDAYAVLAQFPDLKAFRIEGHRTDKDAGRSHRFMLHLNHCPNLEALELKHLFGLRGTSVDKLRP